jgi:hypothetical protein
MKYTIQNKTYNIPNEEIDKLTEALDISIAEACEMYLSDHDLIVNETVEELTKNATKNRVTATIHSAKGEKKDRKPREKKENPLKKEIISKIYSVLKDFDNVTVTNDEKYIDFSIENRDFTINLVEHRKKKGE